MSAIKERIIGAVSLMSDQEAALFWKLIQNKYIIIPRNWNNIEQVEPDSIDLQMLHDIETNPECHEFISADEAMKELEL